LYGGGRAFGGHLQYTGYVEVQYWVNLEGCGIGIGCLGVGNGNSSICVLIPLGVLLVRRDTIYKFVLWTVAPKTDMPLEIM